MEPAPKPQGDLAEEFRKLGLNLKEAFASAWESDERKRLQREIEDGLAEVASTLQGAAQEFSASPTGQQLKADLKTLEARVQSGELETKIRDEFVRALRAINAELEKVASAGGSSKSTDADDTR
jgi:hypothetical protein